ncbi:MAG: hypothetical protein V4787_20730 [Pseudomonadota bacterium]
MKVQPAIPLKDGSFRLPAETAEFVRYAATQIERALRTIEARIPVRDHIDHAHDLALTKAILKFVGYLGDPHALGEMVLTPTVARLLQGASEDLSITLAVWDRCELSGGKVSDFREEAMLAAELGRIAWQPPRRNAPATSLIARERAAMGAGAGW